MTYLATPLPRRSPASLRAVLAFGWCAILAVVLNAAETRSFVLPTGEAGPTLRQFAAQAGQQVIFPESAVAGIKTRAVQGTLAPAEALTRLLAGTGLTFVRDEESGAFAVRVAPSSKSDSLPNAPRVAPLVPAATPNATAVIELSPFDVVDTRNDGYGANRSTSVTLLNQDVAMLPVTTEVMTEAFMRDLNLNGDMSAMVENFGMSAGFASNQNADAAFGSEPGQRQPNAEIKLRGLGTGGIRRDGMIALTGTSSSDAFSTERVEILRGPNALLYQDAGGGGVITAVSKQARFDERASLSFALRTDSFGSLRGEADFNQSYKTGRVWLPRVAVRGAAFLSETRYWRDNVFRKSSGSYLQVAMQLPRTTLRTWYERIAEDNYAGITPGFGYTASRVGAGWVPPPEVIARHIGYNKTVPTLSLSTFLGETTAGGANAASTILNGQLNWQNLSSWLVQKEWTPRAETFGASLESRWSRAFSTLIKYMYRDEERDMDFNRSATLYPAGYRLTDINSNAITTDDWTVVAQPPRLYDVSHRYHSFRAAGSLEWNMWGDRIRSTLVPGVDYSSSNQHEWLTDYYEADSNWNPLTTTSAQNLYRFPMPTAIIFNAARPVRYFRPESDTKRFTYGGRNWVAQEDAPEFYVPATPDNPWGLPTNSITTNRGNWGRYFKWNRGAFSTMYNDWFDGRFTSMFSLRADRSVKRQFLAAQLNPLEVSSSKVSYNTGLTARVHPALRLFLNYSVAQNPAVNMFPDPLGQPLKDAQNTGVEYGVKSSLLNERINLSLSRYTTDAKNEFFLLGIGGSVNPSGLNGSVPGRGSWSNVDRKSDGYELSIDGAPARGWMMRLTAGMQQGRTGTDLTYPIYYNDEFHSDASGGVTWANRAPYLVKINPGDNSANAPTQQLTIAMLNNGDANGNYRAILNPVNGAITNRGDIFTAGTTSIVNGNVGTGRTGLPVTANKLEWDDPLGYDGMYIASRSGMRSLGVPRYTVSFTNSYNFSRGWLKGVRVGGLVSARLQQANQVVRWPVTTYVINKAGTLGVKTSTDNAAAAEIPKVDLPGRWIYTDRGLIYGRPDLIGTNAWISYTYKFRRVTWSTQINISNVFNNYQVLPQPFNGTLYGETRGLYYTAEPRSWAWRNDFRF